MSDAELYKEELEELSGKIYNGDLTPIVFDLLKDTTDVKGLLNYLNATIEEDEKMKIVTPTTGVTFEELFNNSPKICGD